MTHIIQGKLYKSHIEQLERSAFKLLGRQGPINNRSHD
jgi:hypothetical protein